MLNEVKESNRVKEKKSEVLLEKSVHKSDLAIVGKFTLNWGIRAKKGFVALPFCFSTMFSNASGSWRTTVVPLLRHSVIYSSKAGLPCTRNSKIRNQSQNLDSINEQRNPSFRYKKWLGFVQKLRANFRLFSALIKWSSYSIYVPFKQIIIRSNVTTKWTQFFFFNLPLTAHHLLNLISVTKSIYLFLAII